MTKDNQLDLSLYSVRTDLAVEAKDMAVEEKSKKNEKGTDIEGVIVKEREEGGIKISSVEITQQAEQTIGKKAGNYLTIEVQGIRQQDADLQQQVEEVFAKEFSRFLQSSNIPSDASCLIVGLGNWNVTPDSLGPLVCENVIVTRHLFSLQPENVEEGYRSVSAIAPGVMGLTGIETSDIIFGVVEKSKPDFIIAIDALASRSIERVNATIQISDTGIHPGSGVGNKRKELSKETLGVPVIAIGVPTVVDAVSITSDTIDYLLKHFGREMKEGNRPSSSLAPSGMTFGEKRELTEEDLPGEQHRKMFMGIIGTLDEDEKRTLIHEVLAPLGHNLMVTPKEVDVFIEDMANLLATGLNSSLHHAVNQENVGYKTR
ncbi:GPR endopeptidase [Heyndrickxia sporothermodurans]|uniref:Germination protease n=1 Tax=Heyndrickxia sporothermodurans TaxID=46224 RepID=A0AB37H5R8_9BACI|nr:GPR endopeptidase [Heyndrickxia sporothermodurans]MBL5767426.1 GPR endopeptidase [Heyndrickxia sporothermodurans]MBL5770862.1 GPR endopeptidase [Heyndrickxia sporothermodurans]MBL5774937.1 GPR endopeptidase [Heyndrickxia sporothermodurans]MBL5778019.1 GPR endopeptidase [Heyndrickxia sporothermodurans]MBL5781706.1 GPR endopeptidase [Heyndrickxia sporothermodurans]